ncbi:MAG: tetraacyldisaccharide 4'-kinase [Chloroherpetonaceae bacterium]|nr:tetraacyldisaccharide 4'-kinase [Chloroherpetonaceae bacterium]
MKPLLDVLSRLYGALVNVRNWLYDKGVLKTFQSPIPVVSVGNLTTGGAGKTPFVDWIVKHYHAEKKRVAIVSRGYGRKTKGVVLVSDGALTLVSAREAGDEPLMLARRNPGAIVVVAEKRADGVKFLLEKFSDRLPDVILLDDGFQHRALSRELDLLVIHAEQNPANDALLPLGRLREPVGAIKRADLILLSKVTRYIDLAALEQTLASFRKPIVKSRVKIVGLRSFFSGELAPLGTQAFLWTWAFAFSGIGDSKNFVETLQCAGLIVEHQKHFPDHHVYSEADIEFILDEVTRHGINIIVTTEKDYFRLKADETLFNRLKNAACFYLEIAFEAFEGEAELKARLNGVLKSESASKTS